MDIFALLLETSRYNRSIAAGKASRSRGATRPSFAQTFSPKREQGMPGARCTRGLVCKNVQRGAHEHTGSAETLRHPPRNGFTAYAVISSATNSSCHRHRRIKGSVAPGWARKTSADLTPATGAGTTRFCRTLKRRSSCTPLNRSRGSTRPATSIARRRSRVHHIPPRVRDDARPPLFLERDGGVKSLIWGCGEAEDCPSG